MLKKYLPFIVFLALIIGMFWSALFYPSLTLLFTIATILFYLAISISSILKRHKGAENQRQKITKDILLFAFILILVILLGSWSGNWAGKQVHARFGVFAATICAIVVSFIAGYLIKKGLRKLFQ